MEYNFGATRMVVKASKKQNGNVKQLQIKSPATGSSAEMKSDSSSLSSFSEDDDDSVIDTTYIPPDIVRKSSSDCEATYDAASDANIIDVETSMILTSPLKKGIKRNEIIARKSSSDCEATCDAASDANITDVETPMILTIPLKKGVKRKRNESNWMRNVNKKLRNSGKEYKMRCTGQKIQKERKIEPPCTEKCKLRCFEKFTEDERVVIFSSYWDLGDFTKQRLFIHNNMESIQPKYRYVREGGTRKKRDNNNAFYFRLNGEKVRVCKLFFKNTLNINDRPIRTVQEKRHKVANALLGEDGRGKHGKQMKLDEVLKEGVKNFIFKIPKIESHYTRANTSKHFIDGSKSIAEIHRDYMAECKVKKVSFVNYVMFYRIFTEDYNISLFTPKKDLCETCCAYNNAEGDEKIKKEEYYNQHLVEKELSRKEKKYDKEEVNASVAVYDLQAVMQIPIGDVSVFYYKSKLNVFNFTIYDLKSNECECFVWDESNGHRGINELGSCVLRFLNKRAVSGDEDFIFYSDNCSGQQKNKFMVALYIYAISHLNIKSITHKYLVKGHTQNEGDSAHSIIERQVKRQLKGGPMYTPEPFISAIRTAKKTGKPFNVTEMCFEEFFDMRALATEMGVQNMAQLKLSTVVVLRVQRESPNTIFFKTSYNDNQFKEANNIIKKKQTKDITLTRAFYMKPQIADSKKKDLLELIKKTHIPKYYKPFYEQL